ncbi:MULTISPECIES: hypothetical protein [Gulbenkiania]|uniref:Uncharacterized protein n=1 Tax=Gulbenkiania indica TaxID=375574 RepID=A0A0K6H023_9NEIS|nr:MULTISPECIES: hypothetical protein [Gulbenkiania]CUA84094.1 hypothetical protein Ga0061063_2005 [Gulbenkiania indica]
MFWPICWLPMAAVPGVLRCFFALGRSQQVLWRSQCFHNARLLTGWAPWEDKVGRITRRACADWVTYAHDTTQAQGCLAREMAADWARVPEAGQAAQWLNSLQARLQPVMQEELAAFGRATVRY